MLRPRRACSVQQFQRISRSSLDLARSPLSGYRHEIGLTRSKHDGRAVAVYHPASSELFYTEPEVLTGFLASSFFQYKTATDYVASWLENTAKSCGYSIDIPSVEATNDETTTTTISKGPSKCSNRLNGKAKNGAYDVEAATVPAANETTSESKSVNTHKIPLQEFVKMADFIAANSNPTVQVPASFIQAIDSAISARRSHGRQRRRHGQQIKSNMPKVGPRGVMVRHFHFIDVLKHVREALRPRVPRDQVEGPLARKAGELSAEAMDNPNKVEGLEAQQSCGWFLQNPDVACATSTSATPKANSESEIRREMEEAYLGFDRLMQDLGSLRSVIHRMWNGYQSGLFDLATVSLMTNTAIGIARRMQEDVQKIFDKHGGSAKMLNAFYRASCAIDGEDPNFREQPDDDLNFRIYDTAESMMMPIFTLLQSFVEPGKILPHKPDYYGTFDPAGDRSKKSAREKFQEDKIVLLEILSEFLTFHRGVPSQPFEDEFTRGLRLMFDTKDIPIWLVFAAQVFLDIHHSLRSDVKKGFNDLRIAKGLIDTSIMENFGFHSSPPTTKWPSQNNEAFVDTLRNTHQWMDCDPVELKAKPQTKPREMIKFMKWNPLFCGMFMRDIQQPQVGLRRPQPVLPSCAGIGDVHGLPVRCRL